MQQRLSLLARKARLDAEKAGQTASSCRRSCARRIRRSGASSRRSRRSSTRGARRTRRDGTSWANASSSCVQQIKGYEAQVESASQQLGLRHRGADGEGILVGTRPYAQAGGAAAEAHRCRDFRKARRVRRRDRAGPRADRRKPGCRSSGSMPSGPIRSPPTPRRSAASSHEVNEKLQASADVVKRTVVTAPVNGTVVDVKFRTIGGVVQRGEPYHEHRPGGR